MQENGGLPGISQQNFVSFVSFASSWLNHPFEKYDRQNGHLPPVFGVKTKHMNTSTTQVITPCKGAVSPQLGPRFFLAGVLQEGHVAHDMQLPCLRPKKHWIGTSAKGLWPGYLFMGNPGCLIGMLRSRFITDKRGLNTINLRGGEYHQPINDIDLL